MRIQLPGHRRSAVSKRRAAHVNQEPQEPDEGAEATRYYNQEPVDDVGYPIREGYQPCGGGRRIIRKRIGSD